MAAEPKDPQQGKSLEMRVAALEDKLAKLHITEEEMRAYEKVSSLLGGGAAAQAGAPVAAPTPLIPQVCSIVPRARFVQCWPIFRSPIINAECNGCGPCAGGGFSGFGGGFGSFGM
jgi:hypothetical protein